METSESKCTKLFDVSKFVCIETLIFGNLKLNKWHSKFEKLGIGNVDNWKCKFGNFKFEKHSKPPPTMFLQSFKLKGKCNEWGYLKKAKRSYIW